MKFIRFYNCVQYFPSSRNPSVDVFDWILTGGEDHFFLATVSADKASDDLGLLVGKVETGSGVVNLDGNAITKAGYQHF